MTPGAVNQMVNPASEVKPSARTMQLLKLIVATHRPDAIHPETMELREGAFTAQENKLISDIRALPEPERERVYKIIYSVLTTYQDKPAKPVRFTAHKAHRDIQDVNSKLPPDFAENVGKALARKMSGAGEGPLPSGEVGGSNAPSGQRTGRTDPRQSGRRTSPGPAPESREIGKDSGPHKK